MKPLAAPVLIALCRCLHLRRAADLAVQLTASLDPIGDELARRLPDRCDHAGAFTPIGRRLHGVIDNRLRGRKAWIGMVLLGRVRDEKLRSEERRGGKECVSTCRSPLSTYP